MLRDSERTVVLGMGLRRCRLPSKLLVKISNGDFSPVKGPSVESKNWWHSSSPISSIIQFRYFWNVCLDPMIPNWSYQPEQSLAVRSVWLTDEPNVQNWIHDFDLWIKIMTVTIIQNHLTMPRNKMVQISLSLKENQSNPQISLSFT